MFYRLALMQNIHGEYFILRYVKNKNMIKLYKLYKKVIYKISK